MEFQNTFPKINFNKTDNMNKANDTNVNFIKTSKIFLNVNSKNIYSKIHSSHISDIEAKINNKINNVISNETFGKDFDYINSHTSRLDKNNDLITHKQLNSQIIKNINELNNIEDEDLTDNIDLLLNNYNQHPSKINIVDFDNHKSKLTLNEFNINNKTDKEVFFNNIDSLINKFFSPYDDIIKVLTRNNRIKRILISQSLYFLSLVLNTYQQSSFTINGINSKGCFGNNAGNTNKNVGYGYANSNSVFTFNDNMNMRNNSINNIINKESKERLVEDNKKNNQNKEDNLKIIIDKNYINIETSSSRDNDNNNSNKNNIKRNTSNSSISHLIVNKENEINDKILINKNKNNEISNTEKKSSSLSLNYIDDIKMAIGIIGCGDIGFNLLKSLIAYKEKNIYNIKIIVSTRKPESIVNQLINLDNGIEITLDNEKVFLFSDVIFLCVQNHQLDIICKEVQASFKQRLKMSVNLFSSSREAFSSKELKDKEIRNKHNSREASLKVSHLHNLINSHYSNVREFNSYFENINYNNINSNFINNNNTNTNTNLTNASKNNSEKIYSVNNLIGNNNNSKSSLAELDSINENNNSNNKNKQITHQTANTKSNNSGGQYTSNKISHLNNNLSFNNNSNNANILPSIYNQNNSNLTNNTNTNKTIFNKSFPIFISFVNGLTQDKLKLMLDETKVLMLKTKLTNIFDSKIEEEKMTSESIIKTSIKNTSVVSNIDSIKNDKRTLDKEDVKDTIKSKNSKKVNYNDNKSTIINALKSNKNTINSNNSANKHGINKRIDSEEGLKSNSEVNEHNVYNDMNDLNELNNNIKNMKNMNKILLEGFNNLYNCEFIINSEQETISTNKSEDLRENIKIEKNLDDYNTNNKDFLNKYYLNNTNFSNTLNFFYNNLKEYAETNLSIMSFNKKRFRNKGKEDKANINTNLVINSKTSSVFLDDNLIFTNRDLIADIDRILFESFIGESKNNKIKERTNDNCDFNFESLNMLGDFVKKRYLDITKDMSDVI